MSFNPNSHPCNSHNLEITILGFLLAKEVAEVRNCCSIQIVTFNYISSHEEREKRDRQPIDGSEESFKV